MSVHPSPFRSRVIFGALWSAAAMATAVFATMTTGVATAGAQTIAGQVVDANRAPIAAAIVTATNAQGVATHILSSATGQFAFHVVSAGAYDVQVARVGFASTTTTRVAVGVNDTARVVASAPLTPIALTSASTKGANSCRVRPDSSVVTGNIWTEIRKALLTTQVPRFESKVVGQWQEFERSLDSTGKTATHQRVTQATHSTPKLFQSIAAATVSTRGFVVTDASGTVYYAPDVALLLSPEFEATHCLKLASTEKAK